MSVHDNQSDSSTAHIRESTVDAAVGGALVVVLIAWAFEHWKAILGLFIALKVFAFIYINVFSPQTMDMSEFIRDAEQHQVHILKVDVEIDHFFDSGLGTNPATLEYEGTRNVRFLNVEIQNRSVARISNITFRCRGHVSRQPPDHSYKPEVSDHVTFIDAPIQDFEPLETYNVILKPTDGFQSNVGETTCEVFSMKLVEADFYRAGREMDWQGIAGIDDRNLTSQGSSRPTTYEGDQYPIHITGDAVNTTKKTIHGLHFDCEYTADGENFSTGTSITTDIAPGAKYAVDAEAETAHMKKADSALCYVDRVTY